MANDFVHLHTHSEYSLLDGLGRIKKLVAEAKRLGQPALALTDHGVMHGAIEFFRACKEGEIKPIIGIESYQTVWGRPMDGRDAQFDRENYHLLLLAKNQTGYRNLLKIASNSQMNGYYYRPRVDHDFLEKHAEGLIITTGCLGAEVPNLLMQGKDKEAEERFKWYIDVFGKENFFIELQEHSIPELIPVNKVLVPWADKYGINLLATNDVHYVKETDGTPHDVLLCVQTGALVSADKRMRMSDKSYFLKSREQMEATFRPFIDLPASAFDNSLRITDMCDVDLEDKDYHLPPFVVPEGHNYETWLRHMTEAGLQRLYGERVHNEEVQERKERELRVIHEMGFDVYFLIVADLCAFARSKNIWYNVRGSGAGSVVAYCTGITGIDPLKNNLIFERFLNPGRVSMPDFDLDFPDDQREQLIQYTIDTYGKDQVAQIVTFGRMKARAALRDVGRAKGIDLKLVDKIAKLIPAIPGKPVTIQDVLTEGHEFYSLELVELVKKETWVQDLVETSQKLEGVARHSGIHAAAVIVADRELTHYAPLMRGSKGSITAAITQFEFPILESIGLLKVDFLGLSTLSVMREAGRLIKERHAIEFTLQNIPFEGEAAKEAFTLLSSGEVSGVFQVEGQGMRRVLTEMKPTMFEHIIAMISLYRPGPLEYIPTFIRRMHGEEVVEYKHPALESILSETYGILVYQEQIIQALSKLAGYSPGEADLVRRAISKKKASDIEKHKKLFVAGCEKNQINAKAAEAIYGDIEFFARYGFNKCLPGDTEVIDAASGRLVKIEDLYTGAAQLFTTVTCDTMQLKLHAGQVATVMDNGGKPVYRLTTALGRSIEATANHPFYTFAGWRLLEELKVDELIAVPRTLPVEGKTEWPEHQVIALGHLLAEGNLCHPHSVYFYSQSEEQRDDFIQAAEQFENVNCSVAIHKDTFSIYAKRVDRTQAPGIVIWARELGIWGKNAHTKEIPAVTFELTNNQIGLLISRMWEGDGHINLAGRSLFYATASERMARQLQHLLLRLGMISRLRTVEFPYKDGRIGYQVFITGNDNIATFSQTIGIHFVRASRRALLDELFLVAPASSGSKDVVPLAVKEVVRSTRESSGISWLQLNQDCGIAQREFYPVSNHGKAGFARQTIQRLADYFDSNELRRYAKSDVYWDKIVSIEYVGEKQTYDLEVPGTHNFIANDILVHNSHAADYAVITVQTAYLKAHYPVDYMAALLLIERDKTEKVVNFINECRRMGIDVLPPDVNYSSLDFDIQQRPADTASLARRDPLLGYPFPVPEGSAIRFGMAAIKNVGEGPVETIIKARQTGGLFNSLEDFCDRVDLRQVNKRAMECLIKAGAFDRFGKRSQLLAVLDSMVANSAETHAARENGQLSLFGAPGEGGGIEIMPIRLPDLEEVKGREKLQWEKELLGVYTVSHPLQGLSFDLKKVVSCACNELDETHDGKNVVLAGMITTVRTINTKKGDPMAFVQIEDFQGQCEVVVFPRTYLEVKDKLVPDAVLIFKGKAQAREGQTSLLLDSVQNYVDLAVPSGSETPEYQKPLFDATPTINGMLVREASESYTNGFTGTDEGEWSQPEEESPFQHEAPAWLRNDIREVESSEEDESETELDAIASNGVTPLKALVASASEPAVVVIEQSASPLKPVESPLVERKPVERKTSENRVVESLEVTVRNGAIKNGGPAPIANEPRVIATGPSPASSEEPPAHRLPNLANLADGANPLPVESNGKHGSENGTKIRNAAGTHSAPPSPPIKHARQPQEGRCMHITFRRSGDLERDKFRLKEIYDRVRDPRGRDRFFIVLEANGKRYELAFPNDACTISDRLVKELTKHFRVEVTLDEQPENN